MSTPALPSVLPWAAGDLLSWPETILAGGLRWTRRTSYEDAALNDDDRIIEIRDPEGKTLYRGESDACGDTRTRLDVMARLARGEIARPRPASKCPG